MMSHQIILQLNRDSFPFCQNITTQRWNSPSTIQTFHLIWLSLKRTPQLEALFNQMSQRLRRKSHKSKLLSLLDTSLLNDLIIWLPAKPPSTPFEILSQFNCITSKYGLRSNSVQTQRQNLPQLTQYRPDTPSKLVPLLCDCRWTSRRACWITKFSNKPNFLRLTLDFLVVKGEY